MNALKSIDDNIDEFTKLILMLRETSLALGDTSKAMILLNSLPDDYNVVKHALQYTSIVPTLELVISGIKARELELHTSKKPSSNLFVKGKFEKRQNIFNNNGVQDLKISKVERRENKSNLNGSATIVGKRVTLKNIVMILLKNRNRMGM